MTLRKLFSIVTILIFSIAFIGGCLIGMHHFKVFLQSSVQSQTINTANALSFSLSEMDTLDNPEAQTMVNALFETGEYSTIKLLSTDHKVILSRAGRSNNTNIPTWFKRAFPLQTKPASALISKGWQQIGSVEVYPDMSLAYQKLWSSSQQLLLWFTGLLLMTLLVEFICLHFLLKPIRNIMCQAENIMHRKFTLVKNMPWLHDLRNVTIVMNNLSNKIQVAFDEQTNLIKQVREKAYQDSVTKLGNRRYFNMQIDDLLSQTEPKFIGALFILEFKNIELVKTDHSYTVMESYQIEVANIITQLIKTDTTAVTAHLSETTYALLLPNLTPKDAVAFSAILTSKLNQLQAIEDKVAQFHIGVAIYKSNQSRTELMVAADKALHYAEKQGNNNFGLVDLESAEESHIGNFNHFKMILDENTAQQTYTLFFQPVLSFKNSTPVISSLEALFRLKDPADGYISAKEFINLAESHGLIHGIDSLVINKALIILQTYKIKQKIAINISIKNILNREFNEWLSVLLTNNPVSSQLIFEIDENKTAKYFNQVSDFITRFNLFGCFFALDDFGSSFNSIHYLKNLDLHYVKLDSSLIKDIDTNIEDQFYIRTLVETMKNLDIKIIAKGVETTVQQNLLQHLGVSEFQGYLYAKPDLIEKILDL